MPGYQLSEPDVLLTEIKELTLKLTEKSLTFPCKGGEARGERGSVVGVLH